MTPSSFPRSGASTEARAIHLLQDRRHGPDDINAEDGVDDVAQTPGPGGQERRGSLSGDQTSVRPPRRDAPRGWVGQTTAPGILGSRALSRQGRAQPVVTSTMV